MKQQALLHANSASVFVCANVCVLEVFLFKVHTRVLLSVLHLRRRWTGRTMMTTTTPATKYKFDEARRAA